MSDKVIFTDGEKLAMREASIIGHEAWDNNSKLSSLKRKIKKNRVLRANNRCCYCGRNQHGEFSMVIDIEHILPKSMFPRYMFTLKNLSTSCKRCNMSIKSNRIDFISNGIKNTSRKVFKSKLYKFVHPNLDEYDSHLLLISHQIGKSVLMKYNVINKSPKGLFTYEYFHLKDLEKDSFDLSQGGRKRKEIINPIARKAFEELITSLYATQ